MSEGNLYLGIGSGSPLNRKLKNQDKSLQSASHRDPEMRGSEFQVTVEIDDITETENHCDFIQSLVRKHIPSTARQDIYQQRLMTIENRARDPKLYLGIVGEFSAGKSTFINAMLRRRLLKTALQATTASVTRVQPGSEFLVKATFTNGKTVAASEDNISVLRGELKRIQPATPINGSLKGLLDLLTSDPVVAPRIKHIDITVPFGDLSKDLVILDTPGISAGDENAKNHSAVTETVMNEVDGAIVLVPEASPMTKTLISFLDTKAKPFLHRCVFVITAMDRQDDNTRQETVQFVTNLLHDKLELVNPLVFESSAISMIPMDEIPGESKALKSYWQSQFIVLESTLKKEMLRQRILIIAERLVRLLQDILRDLNQDLEEKRARLEKEQKVLRENSLTAIETVVSNLYSACEREVNEQRRKIRSYAGAQKRKFKELAKERTDRIITQAEWEILHYNANVAPAIRKEVEEFGSNYVSHINNMLDDLRACCNKISADFGTQFERNYKAFPSLQIQILVPSISVSQVSIPQLIFHSSVNYTEEQVTQDKQGAGRGATIGGTIGFFLGGPFGAAIGAAIGGFGGFAAAGDSLGERQQKLINYADSDIHEFFEQYEEQMLRCVDQTIDNVLSGFGRAANQHIAEYGAAVATLIQTHQNKEHQLNLEVKQILQDTTELSQRESRLAAAQHRLKNVY